MTELKPGMECFTPDGGHFFIEPDEAGGYIFDGIRHIDYRGYLLRDDVPEEEWVLNCVVCGPVATGLTRDELVDLMDKHDGVTCG